MTTELTVAEIARRLGGAFEGAGETRITGVAGIKEACSGIITFLANPKYEAEVPRTRASAILVNTGWSGTCRAAVIRVADANAAFAEVVSWFAVAPVPRITGIHPTAIIAGDVKLGQDVGIGPYCVLESGVQVGDRTTIAAGVYVGHGTAIGGDCCLYPHVSIREHARIGDRVIIHNGAVIGSDGFGYNREGAKWKKIPQVGVVVIGDDVEIGANVTVDRARFGETRIGNGTKIDNLVQIAHNVTIGSDTAIAAQTGISGSCSVGSRVMLGGQVGMAGHIAIGDDCIVGAQSGVHRTVPNGTFVSGYPAVEHVKWAKLHAHIQRLPELKQRVAGLDRRLQAIENGQGADTP